MPSQFCCWMGIFCPSRSPSLRMRLPHEVVIGDDDARARIAQAAQRAERAPHVVERARRRPRARRSRRCAPASSGASSVSASATTKSMSGCLRRASSTRRGEMSTPTPPFGLRAAMRSPVPQPTSSTLCARGHDEAHQPLDGAIVGAVLGAPAVALRRVAVVLGYPPLPLDRLAGVEVVLTPSVVRHRPADLHVRECPSGPRRPSCAPARETSPSAPT